jgi:hypothetical protein
MTARPGDAGTPPSRRARYKPIVAVAVVTAPILVLVLLEAVVLLLAVVDPSSTCWIRPLVEAGDRLLYPFEIHLLLFAGTAQFWGPLLLLTAALFWYIEWIRPIELLGVAAVSAAVLYPVGFEYRWMLELYRAQYELAGCV